MTGSTRLTSLGQNIVLGLAALTVGACGGAPAPSPTDPSIVVRSFMGAVAAEDIDLMAQLWGTKDGPAADWMEPDQLIKRVSSIRAFLEHVEYEIVPTTSIALDGGRRLVNARVTTAGGCTPVVPFTVVPYAGDWLVESIDLQVIRLGRDCT